MYAITNVDFVEYYSNNVSKDILLGYLMGSQCNYKGKLTLTLKPSRELIQKGPFIFPPIRWVDSFEDYAEFVIVCDIQEVNQNERNRESDLF